MKQNTKILIISTLVISAGAYWYFFMGTGNEAPLTESVSENVTQMQFKALVSELRPISFNMAIFSKPTFMALVDLSTPIAPEALGRLDPFAPISGVSLPAQAGGQ